MAYKKPQIIAKSEPKQTYVAGCVEKTVQNPNCSTSNTRCMCGPLN